MKLLLTTILIIPLILHAQGKGIVFDKSLSWAEVKEKAKKENKYIFLDVFATWCGPCKAMDQEVYTDENLGSIVNDSFISVQVQVDTTAQDNSYIKNWYADAKDINSKYHIQGYPSFLFLNPDGQVLLKDYGYKSIPEFVSMIRLIQDPKDEEYEAQIVEYRNGQLDYTKIRELATYIKTTKKNNLLADTLAVDYIQAYLNKMDCKEILRNENLEFMRMFIQKVKSSDKFFDVCYNLSRKVDSVKGTGWSEYIVYYVIWKEELTSKIENNSLPRFTNPPWNRIIKTIEKKYPKSNARKIVLDYQVNYYRFIAQDWNQWFKYRNRKIKSNILGVKNLLNVYLELNVYGAWHVFLNCNDKKVLRQSLEWIDMAIQLDSASRWAYYDTKANILYKLGEIDKAIELQTIALVSAQRDDDKKNFSRVRDLMQKREPTYLWENAIWTDNTLPQKNSKVKK